MIGGYGGGGGIAPGSLDTSCNWAGRVATTNYQISGITGGWTVPRIVQPSTGGDDYACASWIGLDGLVPAPIDPTTGSPSPIQLIQAGTTVGVLQGSAQQEEAWFEWLPCPAQQITNFDFAAGDEIFCTISVMGHDPEGFIDEVAVTLSNATTWKNTSFAMGRPNFDPWAVPAPGLSADWILELPAGIKGTVLAQFGSVYYDYCFAYGHGGSVYAGDGDLITMVDGVGYELATPVPLNPLDKLTDEAFRVDYEGSA